jgi:hypothetical protein
MQIHAKKGAILFYIILSILLIKCTQNPFEASDKVSPKGGKIRGGVELSDRISPAGVYVWLDHLNIGTWTDKNGQFEMILPSPVSQPGGGITKDSKLYFYLANYQVETAEVVLLNGRALYSHGDINENGELKHDLCMTKIMDIKIAVEPREFPQNPALDSLTNIESELVTVHLTLRALSGMVNIQCSGDELGPIAVLFIKRVDPGKDFAAMLKVKGPSTIIILGNKSVGLVPKTWTASFLLEVGHLAPGNYKIIPYFFLPQQSVPDKLLESLGKNVTLPIETYLNLPMKREGGDFKVLR